MPSREDNITMRMSSLSFTLVRPTLVGCIFFAVVSAMGSDGARPVGALDSTQASPASQSAKATAGSDYIIGPSDVLSIDVWKDTELTRAAVLVRPDGKISLPLIGELEVSGLTALTVQHLIVQKLKEYISNPQVAVIVQEVKSRAYTVLGKIAHPGSFPLGKPTTVLEAIAIAGGFQDFAKSNKIYILRPVDGGSTKRLPFDYKNVIKGRHLEENVTLMNGDTIVVP